MYIEPTTYGHYYAKLPFVLPLKLSKTNSLYPRQGIGGGVGIGIGVVIWRAIDSDIHLGNICCIQ